jgi:hypothetical protein
MANQGKGAKAADASHPAPREGVASIEKAATRGPVPVHHSSPHSGRRK